MMSLKTLKPIIYSEVSVKNNSKEKKKKPTKKSFFFSNSENIDFYDMIIEFKKIKSKDKKLIKLKEISKKFLFQQSSSLMNFSSIEMSNIKNQINELQSKYNLQKLLNENEKIVNFEIQNFEENSKIQILKMKSEERMNQILDSLFDSILVTIKQNMNDSFLRFKLDTKFQKVIKILKEQQNPFIGINIEEDDSLESIFEVDVDFEEDEENIKRSSVSSLFGKFFLDVKTKSFKRGSSNSWSSDSSNESSNLKKRSSASPLFEVLNKRKSNPTRTLFE